MPAATNRLKRHLAASPPWLGTWLMSASPTVAEALGHVGFDWLLLDMEHVPIDIADTVALLRALAATPTEAMVRIPWNDPVVVKRVLDAGAQSLMFPMIQSAEEARRAIAATRYPPAGIRGAAAVQRASRYGTTGDYLKTANDEVCVVLQLETPQAIARLPEIAAVEGLDALFVGPGDLAAAMGHIGDIAHPEVQRALADAARRARDLGRPVGIVGPTTEVVRRYLDMGFTFVAVASDVALLLRAAGTHLTELRAHAAGRR
jgi:2-keto-3-deoxy-L-rhamnonate aldolase RhmA